MSKLPTVHILYENPAWLPPLVEGLEREGFTDIRMVELVDGLVDPLQAPAEGIWINRISPSSHTRGNAATIELGREVLYWLEAHGRRVINGLAAFELEVSKLRQDLVLNRWGIRTPRTVLALGKPAILKAAATFDGPFITKHNQREGVDPLIRQRDHLRRGLMTQASTPGQRQGDPSAVHQVARALHYAG